MVRWNAGRWLRRGALGRASRGLDWAKLEPFLREDAEPDEAEGRLPSRRFSQARPTTLSGSVLSRPTPSGDNLEAVAGRRGVWGGSRLPDCPGCPPVIARLTPLTQDYRLAKSIHSGSPEGVYERAAGRRGIWGESRLPGSRSSLAKQSHTIWGPR